MKSLESLGRTLREAEDELLLDPSRRADVRSRLLARPPRSRRSAAKPALALALGLAVAAAVVSMVRRERPLEYTVGGRPESAGLIVTRERPSTLAFSDGSTIRLAPSSRARVTNLDADGAHVNVEDGAASLQVTHREHTDWTVHAGPFVVHVVGTAFDVAWDDTGAVFELHVREGSVSAEGPRLARRLVRAGERLHIELTPAARTEQRVAVVQATQPTAPAAPEPAVSRRERTLRATAPVTETTPIISFSPPSAPTLPSWMELAAAGQPREAWAAAEAIGIDALLARLGADELLRLADLARRVGDSRASRIYRVIRERFPSTPAAGSAAFLLARLDAQGGDLSSAARGLELYLDEQPRGRYRREALGRLVEVRVARGQRGEAEAAARRYLELHPDGPHAELARRVLGAP